MNVEDIKSPEDIKNLSLDELNKLAADIRSFLLDVVSNNGGHLSSNLGIVELTIALHYFYNAPTDKLLFDVGHQSYVHKILTGRAKKLRNLRQYKGISGFQKRSESEYDCFEAGHSSTALAAALGMATARDLNNENYEVIPIVGDGSLLGGLSLEALNQIGYQKRKVTIIFNDNNMSISHNVGALNDSISKLRNSKGYNGLKSVVKNKLKNKKHGDSIIEYIHDFKEKIKERIIDTNVFGNFGIYYIGPVDGHNIKDLLAAFKVAKSKDMPVVIHCLTKKGYGYKYAENDTVGFWHGISKFDIKTGKPLYKSIPNEKTYSELIADCLDKQMEKNKDIVCLTPAMITGSCLNGIFNKYQDRCFDLGICEDLAFEYACGLSLQGKMPFVSIYSSFIQRAYDQLNHDVARMNLPMVVGIDRCSLVGEDGDTHHGVFDISMIRPLPNVVLCQGKDSKEISDLLYTGFKSKKPFFIRYPRGRLIDYTVSKNNLIPIGKWEYLLKPKKPDAIIISYGSVLNEFQRFIESNKLNYALINARFLKPIDIDMLKEVSKYNKPIYLYTNDILKGGLGDEILDALNSFNIKFEFKAFGIDDKFVTFGSNDKLLKELKLDLTSFFDSIK